ncbi:hypothetical protein H0H92_008530 [Tricholoma furcatifolium]|nr:hypothetical protein H0H92_008530 [Tricholoma furcatifolium]
MTLRAVLSEVYTADKAANDKVPSTTINEAATKFVEASRQDLADKELQEVSILEKYLPPLLSEADIDTALREAIAMLPADAHPQKSLGQVFKLFYQKVDRSTVDTNVVKERATVLLATK